jgi:hypothetical protein
MHFCRLDANLVEHFSTIGETEDRMQYLPEILSFLAGLLGGWTLKVMIDKSKNSTKISGNRAGGDIAGRDINKR